jgi:hypothetical protein
MPLPLLALGAKSALGFAASAEAARSATSKLAMFAREMDESTKTIARLAGGHGAQAPLPPGAQAQTPTPTAAGHDDVTEPVIERPDLVWKHRSTPAWFVGKVFKVRFDVDDTSEYIWVRGLAVAPKRKGKILVGRLANAPEVMEGRIGDVVTFPLANVVDVQAGAKRAKATKKRRSRRTR